jgi:hydrogenase-1 operon protein HyaF
MKAGFWIAPEGADSAMTIQPIGGEEEISSPGRTASGALSLLASMDAEELLRRCGETAKLLPQIAEALETQMEEAPGELFDLTDFQKEDTELISQIIGEGEVTGLVALPDGVVAQIQESVMAGLWRIRFTNADHAIVGDYLEVGAVPEIIKRTAQSGAPEITLCEPPVGTMNVMPVLTEIMDHMARHQPGQPSHVINFSLFPMSPEDMAFLQDRLGDGPIQLISRGYGTCRITATGARHVWSVQYYNAMDTIILDTLEIGDVPVVACAAEPDFRDSAERLREIEEAYFK